MVEFTEDVASLAPAEFVDRYLAAIGTRVVAGRAASRFGRAREGDIELLRSLGLDARQVPLVENVSSTRIRPARSRLRPRRRRSAARPPARGRRTVVSGDRRGKTLGFPTANLRVDPQLLVPAYGIYAGAAEGKRAAISIGVNPHYGGTERRIEAYLLDWEGDLYGDRLVLELWRKLRDERAFASEADLVAQIARDVADTRSATRPG